MAKSSVRSRIRRAANQCMQRLGYEIADFPHATSLDALLKKIMHAYSVDGVIDVGARRGDFAVAMRRLGFAGPMLSFEPVKVSYEELVRRAEQDGNWRCFSCALGSKNESSTIHVTNRTNLCSIRRPNEFGINRFGEGVAIDHEQTIDVRRLDTFLETDAADFSPKRILLKTDTQGWDVEVIRGATSALDRVVVLLSEMALRGAYESAPEFIEQLDYFRSLGFEPSGIYPVNRDRDLSLVEIDCLFVKPASCVNLRR